MIPQLYDKNYNQKPNLIRHLVLIMCIVYTAKFGSGVILNMVVPARLQHILRAALMEIMGSLIDAPAMINGRDLLDLCHHPSLGIVLTPNAPLRKDVSLVFPHLVTGHVQVNDLDPEPTYPKTIVILGSREFQNSVYPYEVRGFLSDSNAVQQSVAQSMIHGSLPYTEELQKIFAGLEKLTWDHEAKRRDFLEGFEFQKSTDAALMMLVVDVAFVLEQVVLELPWDHKPTFDEVIQIVLNEMTLLDLHQGGMGIPPKITQLFEVLVNHKSALTCKDPLIRRRQQTTRSSEKGKHTKLASDLRDIDEDDTQKHWSPHFDAAFAQTLPDWRDLDISTIHTHLNQMAEMGLLMKERVPGGGNRVKWRLMSGSADPQHIGLAARIRTILNQRKHPNL
jgi:hypothetical protein